jgi:hypothetical protein
MRFNSLANQRGVSDVGVGQILPIAAVRIAAMGDAR